MTLFINKKNSLMVVFFEPKMILVAVFVQIRTSIWPEFVGYTSLIAVFVGLKMNLMNIIIGL